MYSKNSLRQLPCYHCVHCKESTGYRRGHFEKRKCALTNRWGSMNKAFYCTRFQNRQQESSPMEINGYRIRKDQVEDYRTENQWAAAGYVVRSGCFGTEMYATRSAAMSNGKRYIYYLPEEVRKA